MMYRVFLFITILAYCTAAPLSVFSSKKAAQINDDFELVDNQGAGYEYFKKQQIDSRPFSQQPMAPISNHDLSLYAQSSAFAQTSPQTQIPPQQPVSTAGQTMSPNTMGSIQSERFMDNGQWSDQQQMPAGRQMGSQQMLSPQNDFNMQRNMFTGQGGRSQGRAFSQQPWSTEQQQSGFSSGSQFQQPSSFGSGSQFQQPSGFSSGSQFQQPSGFGSGSQFQQPASSNFLGQSNQQNMQRFSSQPQMMQRSSSGGW